ncbi:MAG: hypothetical protein N4A49_02830 [Marinifilaceae bacterium]|jgi:hypothetical protein|nr:hypothetical protein [Marinifilaceae bacterium]
MKINLNSKITSTYDGYSHLINMYHRIIASSELNIEISFIHTTWFEANLAAVLGAIIEIIKKEGKLVTLKEIQNSNIKDVLQRNSFLCEFGEEQILSRTDTIAPYNKFSPNEDFLFIQYIKNELLSKPDFPKHSVLLRKKINENIFELYENARTHGVCDFLHTCGQYYHNKKILTITIVDVGKTIKCNVNDYLDEYLDGSKAIEWAMCYGNTTKTGNISGGLGLGIIMEFIKLNNGKIQIISSDGYWEYRRGHTTTKLFDNFFPGTIVNIEFNLNDKNSYSLKEEISLNDIF